MSTREFVRFRESVGLIGPRTAIVLGSGLAGASSGYREVASVCFDQMPGLAAPSVQGHAGRIAVVDWGGVPAVVCHGRLHSYEGHPGDAVTGPVRVLAELGVKTLVLTNSAGGIHPALEPGSLMLLRGHFNLLDRNAWRLIASGERPISPYSEGLCRSLLSRETANGRELLAGTYAAVTGPCYETPAEIRALAACGADAVGMSTAKEAETAAALGLEVAAISCITNRAAGLGGTSLCHAELLVNARLAIGRLKEMMVRVIQLDGGGGGRSVS